MLRREEAAAGGSVPGQVAQDGAPLSRTVARGSDGRREAPLAAIVVVLAALMLVVGFVALCVGRYSVPFDTAMQILASNFMDVDQTWTANQYTVIMNIRLPRAIAAMLIGASLALAGAAYQGVFQNPLVSPDILGVSNGACVGAAASILLYMTGVQTQVLAFVGGLLAVFVTVSIPRLMHRRNNITMVLSGIIVGGFMTAILGLLKYVADPDTQLAEITYWQLGSIAKVNWEALGYVAPVMIACIALLMAMRWRLNLLSQGEDEARTLGVNIKLERGVVIVVATLLTASAVSLSGTIGWIGLIIPHVTRRLVGADNKRLIPCVALVSAIFLLIIDTIARTLTGLEIPISILTGLIGAPLFGYILVKQKDVE